MENSNWPELNYQTWKPTGDTLQRWLQIAGKVRTHLTPWVNHSWQSTFYITATGLTTSLIPYESLPFSIEFDFVRHELRVQTSSGLQKYFALESESVASFYNRFFHALRELGIQFHCSERPDEVLDRTSFRSDTTHCTYDRNAVKPFWQALVNAHTVMSEFRSEFSGKCSPVHFFWGAMDLAVTRFSGRRAPEHPGHVPALSDLIVKEAYSHEVSSCGFWPGNDLFPHAAFYSYAYPAPFDFEKSRDGNALLLSFFKETYEAAAELGHWDREALEQSKFLDQLHELQQNKEGYRNA